MNPMLPIMQFRSFAFLLCAFFAAVAMADPPIKKEGSQNDLTDGLLELLREPAKGQRTRESGDLPVPSPNQPSPKQSSAPMQGEDIGQGPSNPLAEVQVGMATLAQWLRDRSDAARTKDLQRDVVLRLDELIGQLEQQSQSQSAASSSTGQSSQSSQSQTQSTKSPGSQTTSSGANAVQQPGQPPSNSTSRQADSSEGGQGKAEPDEAGQNNETSNQTANSNPPGSAGGGNNSQPGQPGVAPTRSRGATVDLNDPRALQRSAWGNLPERTREQMQSRMVERFLPPYRDEIEAYYRALAK